MRRRAAAALLCVVLCLGLCGCSGAASADNFYEQYEGFEENDSIGAVYGMFTGGRTHEVVFEDREAHTFHVEVLTEAGDFSLVIRGGNQQFYSGNALPSGAFDVVVEGKKTYTIEIAADRHIGEYNIWWE